MSGRDLKVSLQKAGDVKDFIAITQSFTFPMELSSGKYRVDAKSILGVFSLDLSKSVTLTCESSEKDFKKLYSKIKKYEVTK